MEIMKSKIAQHYSCKLLTNAVVLPSLGQSLGEEDENLFKKVEDTLQLLPLGLVRSLLPKVGLRCHEGVVDNEVDVGVVAVEKLDNVRDIGIVQKQAEMLEQYPLHSSH